MTDFHVQNEGTIYVLYALTDEAKQWVADHLPADVMTWGHNGVVIEHRFIADIVNGAIADGLTVE